MARRRASRWDTVPTPGLEFLHDLTLSDTARRVLRTGGKHLPEQTAALKALTERLKAERELADESARYDHYQSLAAQLEAAQANATMSHTEVQRLTRELEETRRQRDRAIAAPAMAVHSEPTGK